MPTHTTPSLLTLAALGALTVPAAASIVTVSGQTTLIAPPANCSVNQLAGTTAFAWDEQQNVAVAGLLTDETQNPGGTAAPVFGVLSGVYDSHFLHFQGIPINNAAGSVTFSGPIVGVIWNNAFLDISDGQTGALGTIYPTGWATRGLFLPPPGVLSVNANVLTFNFQNSFTPNDIVQVRVLTHVVPAPGASALLAAAGLFAARRRR